jgi:rare lipoprotein A
MRVVLAAAVLCAAAAATVIARADASPATRSVIASCYGREHHQVRTATGENYDPSRLTAAHRSWPFGTRVRVTDLHNGRSVAVTINDRGPAAWTHRAIDLSLGACRAIGNGGLARVALQILGGHHEARSPLRPRRHVRRRHG